MPIRFSSREPEDPGPKPFSGEWVAAPPAATGPPVAQTRSASWIPSERLLAAIVVLVIILVAIPFRHVGSVQVSDGIPTPPAIAFASSPTPTVTPEAQIVATQTPANVAVDTPIPPTQVAPQPAASPTTTQMVAQLPGAILPEYRVLSFYGFPGEDRMGILGEYDMDALLDRLQQQAAEYEAADPSRPVKLAFEVIASVAQAYPGDEGNHLAYIDEDVLQSYVDFTAAHDMLLILDMQFGRKTVQDEVAFAQPYLLYPHVHLALDPEFSVGPNEVPGDIIGQIDVKEIMYAQNALAEIVTENNLPPKLLIVHQFNSKSITNKEEIQAVEGVQFVLEVDGFGTPQEKMETYDVMLSNLPVGFVGFKLWYNGQDDPLMTPPEVLALDPPPDLVIYQ